MFCHGTTMARQWHDNAVASAWTGLLQQPGPLMVIWTVFSSVFLSSHGGGNFRTLSHSQALISVDIFPVSDTENCTLLLQLRFLRSNEFFPPISSGNFPLFSQRCVVKKAEQLNFRHELHPLPPPHDLKITITTRIGRSDDRINLVELITP